MNWLLAVAFVFAGTLATVLGLVVLAVAALVVTHGLSQLYQAVIRWTGSPRVTTPG